MPDQETSSMGDLIRFPRNHPDTETTDGTAMRVPAARADQDTLTEQTEPTEHGATGASTELAVDTPRSLRRLPRPQIPPALAGTTQRAASATWRVAKPAGQAGLRHGAYTMGGTWELSRRGLARLSHGDLTDAIRQAKAKGDLGMVADLEQRRKDAADARWKRIYTQAKIAAYTLASGAVTWCATTVAVAVAGFVIHLVPDGASWTDVWTEGYWAFWVGTANLVVWIVSWWPWMLGTVVTALGYAAWRAGKAGDMAPAAVAPQSSAPAQETVTVTADRIVTALKKCGIPDLRNAIKETGGEGMVDIIARYGPGARTTITPGHGIKADTLISKADSIAASLSRDSHELVLSRVEGHAGQVSMWIADNGALDEPVPASPMMAEDYGPVDVYRDAMPWGLSPQGDPVEVKLLQRHIELAGLSKQGKTASARSLALWASLDPSVELRIADLKGVGDWSMFDGIASTLIEGAGDDNELAACDMVEQLCAEMDRRMAKRREQGAKGDVTSKEAKNGSGFHPLVGIIDEVQIAYMSQATEGEDSKRTVGGQKNTSRLWQAAKKLHDQGRAVNIHFWQFAQNPTNANLPAIVREGAHLRGSLYVSSENIARMALGDAPVDCGAAPHRLRNEIDAGTVVLVGASEAIERGSMSTTVRTHYISTGDAYTVAERAKQLRTSSTQITEEDRDLLADVAHALGTDPAVKARDVVARLRELAPAHSGYQTLTAEALAERLETDHAYKVRKKDGYLTVRSDRIQEARDDRAGSEPTD